MKRYVGIWLMVVALFSCSKEEQAFDDSQKTYTATPVSTSDIFPMEFGAPNLPKDNPFTEEGIFLGRMLFYDPILSLDSSVSCASCH
ncbi:MAG: cytochrome c peroxidase, partial [Bacteroidia bacterium]